MATKSNPILAFWILGCWFLALDLKVIEATPCWCATTKKPSPRLGTRTTPVVAVQSVDYDGSDSFWSPKVSAVVGWRRRQSSIRRFTAAMYHVPRGGDLSWGSSTSSSSDRSKQQDGEAPPEETDPTESNATVDPSVVEEKAENETTTGATEDHAAAAAAAGDHDEEDEGSVTPLEEAADLGDTQRNDPPSPETAEGEAETSVATNDATEDATAQENNAAMDGTEPETPPTSAFEAAAVQDDPILDENDSAAYVDRMELADDEGGETTPGGFEIESHGDAESTPSTTTSSPSASVTMSGGDSFVDVGTTEDGGVAQVAKVTSDMEKVLIKELQYTKADVASMKPDHAAIAVQKRLRRPWEGIPANWYKPGSGPTNHGASTIQKVLPKLVLSGLIGAVVVRSSLNGQLDFADLLSSVESLKERFRSPAPLIATASVTPSTTDETAPREPLINQKAETDSFEASITPTTRTTLEADPLPVNEHVNALGEPHAHSIRPGLEPSNEDELDVTWLDKAITAFSRKLRSMFGRK